MNEYYLHSKKSNFTKILKKNIMRKVTYLLLILNVLLFNNLASAQNILYGIDAKNIIPGAEMVIINKGNAIPAYFKFAKGSEVLFENIDYLIHKVLKINANYEIKLLNNNKDQLGNNHYRYILTYNNYHINDAEFIVHVNNGKIYSVNGNLYRNIVISNNILLTENNALQGLLNKINSQKYKWQMPEEEKLLQKETKDPLATYYPKGEIILFKDKTTQQYIYTYRFNVYSDKPLKRAFYYVNASTGTVVFENNLIHNGNTNGIANTRYSGTQAIVTDSTNPISYRLRETTRGQGIETYNMQTGTNYGNAVDFIDSNNIWNNINSAKDEVATDAHWGAEKTWDYFWYRYERNSIDNLGFKIKSYVHFNANYDNAFWDGERMTYGDGNGTTWQPLVALDICAHEITHGLTTFSANLDYQDESGALNESFSDIFGTTVEFYSKPLAANWLMGEDIGSPIRSMSNPNAYNQPDTYFGTNWYTGTGDNGGVHINSGVLNFWFYLLSIGGNGTNDISQTYNVKGVGIDTAGAIAFRLLTVYLTNTSQYADARNFAIIAAADLYGNCSQPVQSVTNAFQAVGIGNAYTPGVQSDFIADNVIFCQAPANVTFVNQSNNGVNYYWNFGDGTTSTLINPEHIYNNYGTYNVKLVADGGICGIDTVIKQQYISVLSTNPCIITMPQTGSISTAACSGIIYDNGGGINNYSDNTDVTTIISPNGATSLTLTFTSFDFEIGYDYLYVYDGNSTSATLIGQYSGTALPNGGTIVSTTGSITLRQTSDEAETRQGFAVNWQCSYPPIAPDCNFNISDTNSCIGVISFTDISTNGPNNWFWDFGDGSTSNYQHPIHNYFNNGIYTVKLITTNTYGVDSIIKTNLVTINKPNDPIIPNDTANCGATSYTFHVNGNGIINWYNSPTATIPIDTGLVFNTPILNNSTTYFVESQVNGASIYGAKTDNTGGGGYYTNTTSHYLVFDCYEQSLLKSVKVYSNSTVSRTFQLQNSLGIVIATKTFDTIPIGASRVTLDFDIPAQNNLRLVGSESPYLFRNSTGISYPYYAGSNIVVKYSSNTQNPTASYYYFYDWEVQSKCFSNRLPLNAYINTTNPVPSFTYNNNNSLDVNFTNTTTQGNTFLWNFGDGTTSTDINPSHIYDNYGAYNVKLIAYNACGVDSILNNINVVLSVKENNLLNNLNIYPNPTNSILYVQIPTLNTEKLQLQIFNITGQIVWSDVYELQNELFNTSIDINKFSKGIYYIRVQQKNEFAVKKIIKL